MKRFIPLFCLLALFVLSSHFHFNELNVIKGKIIISNCPKVFAKGDGYNKDGTEIMQSDNPLTQPERNVIISLHPLSFEPELTLTKDAYISQTEQTFIPNVLPIVVGSKIHFLNEDEFFHNVQSYTPKSRFSIGRRAPGISYSINIKKVGVIDLTCDIHTHMNARILSFETPYFSRINEDGTYVIKDLPDGKYRLEIYHPNCDGIVDVVELIGGEVFEFDYELSAKP